MQITHNNRSFFLLEVVRKKKKKKGEKKGKRGRKANSADFDILDSVSSLQNCGCFFNNISTIYIREKVPLEEVLEKFL